MSRAVARERHRISVRVNGSAVARTVAARVMLARFLREELDLTGTHIGCDTSQCGACTVLLDGVAVKSCTVLAVQADGREVSTVEGLSDPDASTVEEALHPIQKAFWDHHGLQCGYCTPGMVMTLVDLLEEDPEPTEAEIREALAGNLCRCTGYQNIVDAGLSAAAALRNRPAERR